MINKVKKKLKKLLKMPCFIHIFYLITRWQYSSSVVLKFISNLLTIPLFYKLKDRYYGLLMFVEKSQHPDKNMTNVSITKTSRFLPNTLFLRLISNDKSVSLEEYQKFLITNSLSSLEQFEWSKLMIPLGRLDLAKIGFIELTKRPSNQISREMRLESFRYVGITSFILGNNADSIRYFSMTGQYRRALYQPRTPKTYRILGLNLHKC